MKVVVIAAANVFLFLMALGFGGVAILGILIALVVTAVVKLRSRNIKKEDQ